MVSLVLFVSSFMLSSLSLVVMMLLLVRLLSVVFVGVVICVGVGIGAGCDAFTVMFGVAVYVVGAVGYVIVGVHYIG